MEGCPFLTMRKWKCEAGRTCKVQLASSWVDNALPISERVEHYVLTTGDYGVQQLIKSTARVNMSHSASA